MAFREKNRNFAAVNKKILIVDDEEDLCEILQFNLSASFETDTAMSGEEAIRLLNQGDYDLILLDVMMPGLSGFELARILKSQEHTAHIPIIFVTAKDTIDDTVEGLNIGADDYIAKPFSIREVTARVKAVLRRTADDKSQTIVSHEGLVMNCDSKTIRIDGEHIDITKTEFDLLKLLLTERGQVFSREQLMNRIWKGVVVTDRTVDVNITRLRKKIGRYAANIATRQGFGYYFEENV